MNTPQNSNHSHYVISLGGGPADEEKGIQAIPPIFELSFSKENLWSWETCGACRLIWALLRHPSLWIKFDDNPQNHMQVKKKIIVLLEYHNKSSLTIIPHPFRTRDSQLWCLLVACWKRVFRFMPQGAGRHFSKETSWSALQGCYYWRICQGNSKTFSTFNTDSTLMMA